MNIYINNKLQDLPAACSIALALEAINISSPKGIAVAINNNVIPKAEWASYTLQHEDQLTLIKATQGG